MVVPIQDGSGICIASGIEDPLALMVGQDTRARGCSNPKRSKRAGVFLPKSLREAFDMTKTQAYYVVKHDHNTNGLTYQAKPTGQMLSLAMI